jgi:predicted alpha/beta-hydrolase family hydrolase
MLQPSAVDLVLRHATVLAALLSASGTSSSVSGGKSNASRNASMIASGNSMTILMGSLINAPP